MKKLVLCLITVVIIQQLSAQNTSRIESSYSGSFKTISISLLDSLKYEESVTTTKDGGTATLLIATIEKNTSHFSTPLDEIILHIFPNPGKGIYTVSVINSTIQRIEVFSMVGLVVQQTKTSNSQNTSLDISNLEKGVYLVRITFENGAVKTQRVVFQ